MLEGRGHDGVRGGPVGEIGCDDVCCPAAGADLHLDDGALAYLQTRGFRHGPPEVLARIATGEMVDPDLYYFRVQMSFETASLRYGWLSTSIAVGSAADAVVYDAYLLT